MCPIILILKIADIMLNFAIKKPYNRTIIVHTCKASQFLMVLEIKSLNFIKQLHFIAFPHIASIT